MIKDIVFIVIFSIPSICAVAQSNISSVLNPAPFRNLEVSANVGSMGVSLEAKTHVTSWMDIRAGVSWMPQIHTTMGFGVQVGEEEEKKYDENGNRVETKFDKMSAFLEDFTGYHIDETVNMECQASFVNARFMVDLKPFTNKGFHLTAGFFWGTKTVGRAINCHEDMSTTLSVGIYNSMYEKIENFEPIFGNIYVPWEYEDLILSYGRMGMPVGYFKSDGSLYLMEPDKDGAVRAWAKVNSFKPYVGFGWDHEFSSLPGWRFGCDAGVIFWGGVPNVYTHDGTSLTRDVKNLNGKVGDVVSFVKAFPVYPLVELKISKILF